MKARPLLAICSFLVLSGCMVTTRPGGGVEFIPILPALVEVDMDDHYYHNNYHYFYSNERWYYSNARDGRRVELPRSHWPRETRRHDKRRGGHR